MDPNCLPPGARRKFEALEKNVRDAVSQLRSAVKLCDDWEAERRRSIALKPAAELAAAEAKLAKARASECEARFNEWAEITSRLHFWAVQAHTIFEDVPTVTAKLRKGESLPQALDRTRETIRTLTAELQRVRTAALPVAELKALATALVTEQAAKGKPQITTSGGQFIADWRRAETFDAFLAWLNPEAMITKLHAEINALKLDDVSAVPAAERAGRIADLEAQILRAERTEESFIEQAERVGEYIARRPDANPLAILGLQVKVHAAQAA